MHKYFVGSLSAIALVLFVAACGDDSSSEQPDMSVNGQTCLQVVGCIENCESDPATCAMTCASHASPKAMSEYEAGLACGYGVCTKPGDGGAAACASMTDTSTPCINCVVAAVQSSTCSTQFNACLNGT
jgi:hypothetical protein